MQFLLCFSFSSLFHCEKEVAHRRFHSAMTIKIAEREREADRAAHDDDDDDDDEFQPLQIHMHAAPDSGAGS